MNTHDGDDDDDEGEEEAMNVSARRMTRRARGRMMCVRAVRV